MTALLASYFDILFAVNRVPHPGEKRLLAHVDRLCPKRPPALEGQIEAVLRAVGQPELGLLSRLHALLDGLDTLLVAEGLLTPGRG